MSTPQPQLIVCLTEDDWRAALAADVRAGLTAEPQAVPAKWLYDPRGCELFEEITELPEYYPTRAERAILTAHAATSPAGAGAATLVELGSGTSTRPGCSSTPWSDAGTLRRFVAFDVGRADAAQRPDRLARTTRRSRWPGWSGDFEAPPRPSPRRPTAGWSPSSAAPSATSSRPPARPFLADLAARLRPGEGLLLGIDLVKDPARLVAAYDDAAGVTGRVREQRPGRGQRRPRRRLRPRPLRLRRPLGPRSPSRSSMGLRLPGPPAGPRSPPSSWTVELADGEEIAHRDRAPSSAVERITAELRAAGFVAGRRVDRPRRRLAVTLARRSA